MNDVNDANDVNDVKDVNDACLYLPRAARAFKELPQPASAPHSCRLRLQDTGRGALRHAHVCAISMASEKELESKELESKELESALCDMQLPESTL